jgi:glutaredoxin
MEPTSCPTRLTRLELDLGCDQKQLEEVPMTGRESTDVIAVEQPGLVPNCPHCNDALNTIATRTLEVRGSRTTRFGKRYLYACPSCKKLLGITHRKGFWMG